MTYPIRDQVWLGNDLARVVGEQRARQGETAGVEKLEEPSLVAGDSRIALALGLAMLLNDDGPPRPTRQLDLERGDPVRDAAFESPQ